MKGGPGRCPTPQSAPEGCPGFAANARTAVGLLASVGLAVALAAVPTALAGSAPRRGAASDSRTTKAAKREVREVSGLVIEVQPNELTLESKDARTIKLTTFEDYTDQVAVGSQVTAWYYPQDSGEAVLKSLERPAEILFVPVSEIEQRVRRVIVLPNSQVPGVEGFCASLRDYLQAHLGWYVAPGYLAEEIRKRTETSGSTLAAIDPATGNFDLKTYLSKTEGVVQKVASETRSDAVLEVDVLPVQAPVTRMIASWDGVEEPVSGAGMRTLAKLSMFSHKGEVQAATVELKLWSAQGRLLWRNRRGLALLQVLAGRGNRLRERPLSEYLENAQAVQAWMKAAFKALPTATNSGSGPEGQRL